MQGRQCSTENKEQNQHTRPIAGGQSLSAPVITGTASMERLRETTQKLGCLGCTALAHTQSPETSGELEQSAGCTAMQQTPEDFQSAFMHSGYHSLLASLVFLRWRRLISPFTAVTINCAFVSPSSRLLSNSETTSCGKRALSCCDLLLVEPVAITGSPCIRCDSVYAKKMIIKDLKCDSLEGRVKNRGAIHLCSSKPGSARTLTGPLTTNRYTR